MIYIAYAIFIMAVFMIVCQIIVPFVNATYLTRELRVELLKVSAYTYPLRLTIILVQSIVTGVMAWLVYAQLPIILFQVFIGILVVSILIFIAPWVPAYLIYRKQK
jgi:hypothetical protein